MEKRGYLSDRDEMYLGGRVGFMDGDIVGTEQMDDEELQRQQWMLYSLKDLQVQTKTQ